MSRKSGIERGERESGRVWQRKFGVQCATEISAAAERTCGSLFLYYIFPRRTFWFEREREFSDAAAIFSLHDTRARWIAFKDSYIQGQRSSGRTPHFFSLYCLLVGRKKKKKRTLVCAVHAPEPCWNISRALLPSILARLSFSLWCIFCLAI